MLKIPKKQIFSYSCQLLTPVVLYLEYQYKYYILIQNKHVYTKIKWISKKTKLVQISFVTQDNNVDVKKKPFIIFYFFLSVVLLCKIIRSGSLYKNVTKIPWQSIQSFVTENMFLTLSTMRWISPEICHYVEPCQKLVDGRALDVKRSPAITRICHNSDKKC